MKKLVLALMFVLIFSALPFSAEALHVDQIVACSGVKIKGDDKSAECNFDLLVQTAKNLIEELLFLSVFVAAIAFTFAGFKYMSAGGDTAKMAEGKEIFKNVAIGLAIAFAAWLIVNGILRGLKVDPDIDLLKDTSLIEQVDHGDLV